MFISLSSLLSAQEVTSQLIVEEKFTLNLAEKLVQDDDRLYFYISGVRASFRNEDLGYDLSFIPDDEYVLEENGDSIRVQRAILFEYEPGVGIVDHTLFDYGASDFFTIDDSLYACIYTQWFGINGNIIDVEEDDIYRITGSQDIILCDKRNSNVLWQYKDEDLDHQFDEFHIEIDGDFIYYATTYSDEQIFMGDSLTHTYDGFIQHSTMLHKINWRTGNKVWSRRTGVVDLKDKVTNIKVVDDGTIFMVIQLRGAFTWDNEQLDPDSIGEFSSDSQYNTVIAKISPSGEYIDHVHIDSQNSRTVRDTRIGDDGRVICYGVSSPGDFTVVGLDTLDFSNDVATVDWVTGSGALIVFDSNLNLDWYKSYSGDAFTILRGGNPNEEGVLVSSSLEGSLEIDGITYTNEYIDFANESQQLLINYDLEGNVKGEPIQFGNNMQVKDILKVGHEHYLLFIRVRNYPMLDAPYFFGTEIGTDQNKHNNIIEIKGNLFNVLTSLSETFKNEEFIVSPNPVHLDGTINIEFEEEIILGNCHIKLINANSQVVLSTSKFIENNNIQITTPNVLPGLYILLLNSSDGKNYRKKIIIE